MALAFPELVEDLAKLSDLVLDGELVILDARGTRSSSNCGVERSCLGQSSSTMPRTLDLPPSLRSIY